jgi:hypothetical protein
MAHEMASKPLVYSMDGVDDVIIEKHDTFDLYRPPIGDDLPAVLIVAGYPHAGFSKFLGCAFNEMQSVISWARLIAASGMIAITTNDTLAALRDLPIDRRRIGLWASSGNAPLALSLLTNERFACGVLCYPYTIDTSDMAKMFGFANPPIGDLATLPPLFVVRCGRDETPQLNETLDRFASNALAANAPLTFVNHPDAPHAFDLMHDSENSRDIIRAILRFLHVILNRTKAGL